MEFFLGRAFLIILLCKTDVQAILSLSLEPLVKIYSWLAGFGGCCEISPDK